MIRYLFVYHLMFVLIFKINTIIIRLGKSILHNNPLIEFLMIHHLEQQFQLILFIFMAIIILHT